MNEFLDQTILRRAANRVSALLACGALYLLPLMGWGPGGALFGVLVFPIGFFHVLYPQETDYPVEYYAAYWIGALGCHAAFIVSRYWLLFAIPCVLYAVTVRGCAELPGRIGP